MGETLFLKLVAHQRDFSSLTFNTYRWRTIGMELMRPLSFFFSLSFRVSFLANPHANATLNIAAILDAHVYIVRRFVSMKRDRLYCKWKTIYNSETFNNREIYILRTMYPLNFKSSLNVETCFQTIKLN